MKIIYCAFSVKLNNVVTHDKISLTEQKWHRWYYVNLIISEYFSWNRQGRLAIDDAGSQSMEQNVINAFYQFFKS